MRRPKAQRFRVLDLGLYTEEDLEDPRCRGLPAREVDERVKLLTTNPNFGGVAWWFACPFTINGERCGSRGSKLYLPNLSSTPCVPTRRHKLGLPWLAL